MTYNIESQDKSHLQVVREVIDEWDRSLEMLELSEVHQGADVIVQFAKSDNSNEDNYPRAAKTSSKLDDNGLVEHVTIVIFTEIIESDSQVLKQLVRHELGHAFGLGHANFKGDLMSPLVFDQSANISECDITGVMKIVNQATNDNNLGSSANRNFESTLFDESVLC